MSARFCPEILQAVAVKGLRTRAVCILTWGGGGEAHTH